MARGCRKVINPPLDYYDVKSKGPFMLAVTYRGGNSEVFKEDMRFEG